MFLLLKKNLFSSFFLLPLLISCSSQKSKNTFENSSNNYVNNQSINLTNLRINLYKSDKKLTPQLIRNNDGSSLQLHQKAR